MSNGGAASFMAVFSDMIARRYALVGLFVTGLSYIFLYLCIAVFGFGDLASNILTLIFGLSLSYILNRRISFDDKRRMRESVFRFAAVSGLAYAANLVVLFALLNLASVPSLPAQIVSFSVYTVLAYLLHRAWTFSGTRT